MEEKFVEFTKGYLVTSYGRIISLNYKKQGFAKELKQGKNKKGYKQITIKNKGYRVSRLVAMAFVERPEHLKDVPFEDLEVDHINGDRENNSAENLRWCTDWENNHFELCEERRLNNHPWKLKTGKDNPRSVPVIQYTKDGYFIAEFAGLREAERQTSVRNNNISMCCKGKIGSAGGYIWRYA